MKEIGFKEITQFLGIGSITKSTSVIIYRASRTGTGPPEIHANGGKKLLPLLTRKISLERKELRTKYAAFIFRFLCSCRAFYLIIGFCCSSHMILDSHDTGLPAIINQIGTIYRQRIQSLSLIQQQPKKLKFALRNLSPFLCRRGHSTLCVVSHNGDESVDGLRL